MRTGGRTSADISGGVPVMRGVSEGGGGVGYTEGGRERSMTLLTGRGSAMIMCPAPTAKGRGCQPCELPLAMVELLVLHKKGGRW
jgi:hypothetical protein